MSLLPIQSAATACSLVYDNIYKHSGDPPIRASMFEKYVFGMIVRNRLSSAMQDPQQQIAWMLMTLSSDRVAFHPVGITMISLAKRQKRHTPGLAVPPAPSIVIISPLAFLEHAIWILICIQRTSSQPQLPPKAYFLCKALRKLKHLRKPDNHNTILPS